MANADRIDHCIARDESLSDLAGVPVTIKVNIDQAGKINTNGLLIQKDHLAEIDNPVVNNLKKAGAIIIGTTNTPAFSMRWFTNCLLYTSPSPRDATLSRMPSSA